MSRSTYEVTELPVSQLHKLVHTNISVMITVIIINPYQHLHITFKIQSRMTFKAETPGSNLQCLAVNFSCYLLLNNLNLIISP